MDVFFRATAIFFMLFIALRLIGKRQLGEMTPFEIVGLVVLGDFVQQAVTHNDYSVTGSTIAVFTFTFWSLVLGIASYRSDRVRQVLESEPRVLIQDGSFLDSVLERDNVTRDEVLSEMRLAGIPHLGEVEWGILEPNGKVSFLKRHAGKDDPPPEQDNGPAKT